MYILELALSRRLGAMAKVLIALLLARFVQPVAFVASTSYIPSNAESQCRAFPTSIDENYKLDRDSDGWPRCRPSNYSHLSENKSTERRRKKAHFDSFGKNRYTLSAEVVRVSGF